MLKEDVTLTDFVDLSTEDKKTHGWSFRGYFKCFIKSRSVGFWIYLAVFVFTVTTAIVYAATFKGVPLSRYYDSTVYVVPLIISCASLVVALVDAVSKWAPFVLFVAGLYGLCQLINTSYLYLSSNFYGGISMSAITGMDNSYLFVIAAYFIIVVVSIVIFFLGVEKRKKMERIDHETI